MALHLSELERQILRNRLTVWLYLALGAFGLLVIRFWILQVVQRDLWNVYANENQIRSVRVPANRGKIYDRNHGVLADVRQGCNVMVVPADLTDASVQKLAGILDSTTSELRARIKKNRAWSPFIAVKVAEDISPVTLLRVEENKIAMPGVSVEEYPVRKYYEDSAPFVSHVLGYMGEITPEMLTSPEFAGYRPGDRVGRTGVERTMERTLHGWAGVAFKLVDARGRDLSTEAGTGGLPGRLDYSKRIRELEEMSRPVSPGNSVVLTIDLELQRIAAGHMEGKRGSVVVVDVKTGEILALLSSPGYDPKIFESKVSPEDWKSLADSPEKPLLNRAIAGAYPPGSIFKIVMAAAGLEEQVIRPTTTFKCEGYYTIKDTRFGCWNKYGHGSLDLYRALTESCDVYFYMLGEKLGIDKISEWSRKFGLGKEVGIGLEGERSGLIPDKEWKRARFNKPWYPGETLHVSIGQGWMLITPLQAVLIPAAAANDGVIMKPQLIHHFENARNEPVSVYKPQALTGELYGPGTARVLRTSMEMVVEDPKGTARKHAHSDLIRIAGKTGTAEVSKRYQGRPIEEVPYKYRDHAWFIAYAPAEAPRIAMVVMVEHGGSGGAIAGVIARQIIEDYYLTKRDEG